MAEIGKSIETACDLLKKGKLVAIPTDTVYGLACSALDEAAIDRIFEVKNRAKDKPLIAQTDSLENAQSFLSHIPKSAFKLAQAYWPGALTLVLPTNDSIPKNMVNGGDTLGLRIPNHLMTLELLTIVAIPLAVTSANRSSMPSPISAEEVNEQIGDRIEYILDAGKSPIGIESTIVGFTAEKPVILRSGAINEEDILKALE